MILEHISTPADVKALSGAELKELCGELRQFLVESVARTGGHLASNTDYRKSAICWRRK